MEGKTTINLAKSIMGNSFVGPQELISISNQFPVAVNDGRDFIIPAIPFNPSLLKELSSDYILILGTDKFNVDKQLTINDMRNWFGTSPQKSEPCFYNQDWYLNHDFAGKGTLEKRWYLLKKM